MMIKNKINKINIHLKVLFLFFVSCSTFVSQTITPQVINSAGNNWTLNNGYTVSDNVGEPFITTLKDSVMITQGFLQNLIVQNVFSVSITSNDVSCKDKNDGNISTAITTNLSSFSTQYTWTPQSICLLNNCNSVDSLKPGTYTVTTKITYTVGQSIHDTTFVNQVIIRDQNGPCKVKIYTGITANGDGVNDGLIIENITDFPNNHILIYNRWGLQIYEETGYDNVTKFWPRKDDNGKLASTTYFYVLYLGDGSNPIKGWVELLKN